MKTSTVYLLHFDEPISPDHTTQHYMGSAAVLRKRLDEHRQGSAARLTQVACERGIGFSLARTWPGGRQLERKLKNQKCGPKLCPICNPPQTPTDPDFTLEDVEEILP